MIVFLIRRFFQLIPVMWGVATLVFFLIHMVPGDPVDIMLGDSALPASREMLRSQLNLDRPLMEQYVVYWKGLLQGDLGVSLLSRRSVSEVIWERLPATVELALLSILIAIVIAIPIGVASAVMKYTWFDRASIGFSLLGVSMPNFWLGPLLVLFFSIHLGWFPVSERGGISSYILPSVTLGLSLAAILSRMTRASLLDVLSQDYIMTAKSKGLSNLYVYMKHALKNSLIPVITILGLQLGSLMAGTVITETIFDWPGIGELLFRGIQSRDYPLVQGCVLVIAAAYVLANTLADIAYSVANPRIRLE